MVFVRLNDAGVTYRVSGVKRHGSNVLGRHAGGDIQFGQKGAHVSALQNISINIEDGDKVGLLGHNGAGKSTLLKVVSGLLPPTSGSVQIKGKVVPLLSMSLGLDNYSSGRQNIFLRAQLMGIHKELIQERLKNIEEFSDLGEYLDLPLRTYSSGMRMRLAFAIATSFEPEILVLDEWLSAGDTTFKKKASDRMNSLVDSARILVVASHSRNLIKRVCEKAIVLRHGRQIFVGSVDEALDVLDDPLYEPGDGPVAREQRRLDTHRKRLIDIIFIKDALQQYYQKYNSYPDTGSEWVGKNLEKDTSRWISDLAPEFVTSLPQDPSYSQYSPDYRYLYKSNAKGYKLIAIKPGDMDLLEIGGIIQPDPQRSGWAYGVWTDDYENL